VIRSERAGSESFLNEVSAAVWSVNSNLPLASVRTMQEVYDQSMARISFTLVMLGIAGAMALVLGIIGIYGVMSYTVAQRKREIGVRLALGAQGADVLQMVLKQGARLTLLGVAIGVVAAFGLTRLMTHLLFGVAAHDPLTFVAVAVLLLLIALSACYIPARRATRVNPVVKYPKGTFLETWDSKREVKAAPQCTRLVLAAECSSLQLGVGFGSFHECGFRRLAAVTARMAWTISQAATPSSLCPLI
jgi:predicted lysophospholipase L1 biosynthesis ABC-type transport system permease subunit